MSAIAAVLALAVQIVTLKPADLPAKPVYVRVGVDLDSRLMLPEGLVRLHGQRATSDMLGLKLGQARPRAVLLLHPRSAGVGRLMFVGPTRTLWLVVEASTLGTAQDVDLRMADEPVSEESKPSTPAPPAAQAPKTSSVAPMTGPPPRTAAAARPTPPRADGYPARPTPRPSPSPRRKATAAKPGLDGVPTPAPPRRTPPANATPTPDLAEAPTAPASTADEARTPAAAPAQAEPATVAVAATEHSPEPAPIIRRLMRRVGRPGQRGVVLEELRRDGARLTLRARIEGARGAQLVQLELAGVPTALNVQPAGHDLVVVGTVADAAQLHVATLIVSHAGRWHTTKLRFPRGGTV